MPVKDEKIQEGDRQCDIEMPSENIVIYCSLQVHERASGNPFY